MMTVQSHDDAQGRPRRRCVEAEPRPPSLGRRAGLSSISAAYSWVTLVMSLIPGGLSLPIYKMGRIKSPSQGWRDDYIKYRNAQA